jgi:hypothetical protein
VLFVTFVAKFLTFTKPSEIILTKETEAIKHMGTENGKNNTDPEWENRRLCPDGNCIGIIGPDGRCKECGMTSGNPEEGAKNTAEAVNTPSCGCNSDSESDPEWENRKLCPDGNCIGIIGPDGRCGECGKEG